WLARRKNFEVPLKQFVRGASRKHRDLLQLEESLFDKRKAGRVIAASRMVANEITDLYHYPADKIYLIRNGVPLDRFRFDLAPRYAAADIFILPTIYDPFSNACLEALASGLPVITTRSNGFSEIIENEVHGSFVDDPANLVRLRDAIRFWSDPSRRDAARS